MITCAATECPVGRVLGGGVDLRGSGRGEGARVGLVAVVAGGLLAAAAVKTDWQLATWASARFAV